MYLAEVHRQNRSEDQAALSQYVNQDEQDVTTIAVVRDPTGGIVEATDEFMPELALKLRHLNEMRSVRNELSIDDTVKRHNRAVEMTDLEEKYKKHLKSDKDAREKINELKNRVESGENIAVVCFEKPPKWCHRHMLRDHIEELVD